MDLHRSKTEPSLPCSKAKAKDMTRSIIRAWQSQDQSSEHAFLISSVSSLSDWRWGTSLQRQLKAGVPVQWTSFQQAFLPCSTGTITHENPLQFWSALSQRPNQFASTFISWASAPPKRNPGAAPLNQRWHPSEIRRSEQDLKQAWKLENCFVDVSNVSLPDFTLALAKLHHGGQSRLYFPHWKALASSK